jgi:nitrate reductase assembly molybdenum cofactor insertion protein NarJ
MRHYERLAALFEYPAEDYPSCVRAATAAIRARCTEAAAALDRFAESLPEDGPKLSPEALDEMQEIFTRSFDVQAITTLSIGYIVFGDDYKRGELLVNLNREHRQAGIDCGSELSDHLPNVLRLMVRWQDRETMIELVEEILRPALRQMTAEFGTERMEQRDQLYKKHFKTLIVTSAERGGMFRMPLEALAAVLDHDFPVREREEPEPKSDFLRSLGQELDIEAGAEPSPPELVQLRSQS